MADLGRALQGLSMMSTGVGNAMMGYQQMQNQQMQKQQYYDQLRKQEQRVAARDQFNQQMAQQNFDQRTQNAAQDKTENTEDQQWRQNQQRISLGNMFMGENSEMAATVLAPLLQRLGTPTQSSTLDTGVQPEAQEDIATGLQSLGDLSVPTQNQLQQNANANNQLTPVRTKTQRSPAFEKVFKASEGIRDKKAAKLARTKLPKQMTGHFNTADNASKKAFNIISGNVFSQDDVTGFIAASTIENPVTQDDYIEITRLQAPELFSKDMKGDRYGASPREQMTAFVPKKLWGPYQEKKRKRDVTRLMSNAIKAVSLTDEQAKAFHNMPGIPLDPSWTMETFDGVDKKKRVKMLHDLVKQLETGDTDAIINKESGEVNVLVPYQKRSWYTSAPKDQQAEFDQMVRDGIVKENEMKGLK